MPHAAAMLGLNTLSAILRLEEGVKGAGDILCCLGFGSPPPPPPPPPAWPAPAPASHRKRLAPVLSRAISSECPGFVPGKVQMLLTHPDTLVPCPCKSQLGRPVRRIGHLPGGSLRCRCHNAASRSRTTAEPT